jgi:LacI family transcriptional regulator
MKRSRESWSFSVTTLRDVAKLAGVSTAAASYVLTGKKKMSEEVIERVHQAMSATGYKPNQSARALRTGQTKTLGLIVPDITNPFFPQLAQAIEMRARAEGYATVLMESSYEANTEARELEFLTQRGVDGLIWILSGHGRLPAEKPTVPTVLFDYAPHDWHTIHADDYGGGRMQARFALQAGHTNVALLWGPLSITAIQERRRGFYDESNSKLKIALELESPFSLTLAKGLERKLLAQQDEYSLLVCGNDVLAIAAMKVFKKAGVEIPGKISVIGFDDTPLSDIVDPPLTTIAQPIKKLGSQAVELLLGQIQGRKNLQTSLVVPVSLVERGSTKRLKETL